jgi:RNA polymerase sigma-70 factor (ECF subfamily)
MVETIDTEAAATRFESYLTPILTAAYGTALHMTRHPDDAEDLVKEAALQAFRAFSSFQEGTNFKAWFFRIMTNLFINRYRKRQREPEIDALHELEDARRCICTSRPAIWACIPGTQIRRRLL